MGFPPIASIFIWLI